LRVLSKFEESASRDWSVTVAMWSVTKFATESKSCTCSARAALQC